MGSRRSNEIMSLNDSILGELSIEELESRLKMEKLDVRREMWTCSCDCAVVAPPPCPCEWMEWQPCGCDYEPPPCVAPCPCDVEA